MKARILPREEWSRLDTGFPAIGTTLRPDDSQVIVVEDESGKIVASVGTFRVTHFEGLWIAPEHRGNAGVARSLMKECVAAARKWTDEWVWGSSGTDHMDDILKRLGGKKMPVDTYIVPLG